MNRLIVDIVLASFPVSEIIAYTIYGFNTAYAPDHFYAWRDEGITWMYYVPDTIPSVTAFHR